MSDCRHGSIVTYMLDAADTAPIWACADCMLRFYPACRTCIDVGHRSGTHQPSDAENTRLREVEEAARALLEAALRAVLDSLPLDVAASAPETPDLSTNGR